MNQKENQEFGILESDLENFKSANISKNELLKQIEILTGAPPAISAKEPATFQNGGIKKLNINFLKDSLKTFEDAKNIDLVNVVPAAGAASRQFQLLKTVYFNPIFKNCFTFDEVMRENEKQASLTSEDQIPLFNEIKDSLPKFWYGIIKDKYAFLADLEKVLEENNLNLEELISTKSIKTIIKYIIEPCGLNYKNLPKALLKFHSYKGETERLALEEHLRLCILTNKNSKKAKIHFIISDEHTSFFSEALSKIKKQESFISFCSIHNFDLKNLEVSYSYQEKKTDTISLDVTSNKLARDQNGFALLRKSGHGALLNNLNSIDASGIWLQNIDNVLFDNALITKLSVIYKRLMAGIALELKYKRDSWLKKLKDEDNLKDLSNDCLNFLKENFGIKVEFKTKDLKDIINSLIIILDRPIVVAGYVPLKSGQKGGGPFVIEEELKAFKVYKINTVEGVEFKDGQNNPIFSEAQFFNPVNFFILKTKADGTSYDLMDCLDEKRYFVSTKSDINGNPIKALERPGLWNGSISKALQICIPIPENLFSAVKTVAGKESFLSPLHQENDFDAFTENDFKSQVVSKDIASFCSDYKL